MTIKVYAWPPVAVTGSEWTEEAPVQVSRSLVTGAEYRSAVQRKRRLATLQVAGLGLAGNMNAGYVEMLKRFLGGVHAVRLRSYPINWWLDAQRNRAQLQKQELEWTASGLDLDWTSGGAPLIWYTGVPLTGTIGTADGWDIVTVTGLPPNMLVARPGEFVTARSSPTDEGTTAQVVAPARSDASGVAVIRLFEPLAYGGTIELGASDTGVFYPVGPYPRSVQPVSSNWHYDWSFREVFEDEVGGFEEIDPWS